MTGHFIYKTNVSFNKDLAETQKYLSVRKLRTTLKLYFLIHSVISVNAMF